MKRYRTLACLILAGIAAPALSLFCAEKVISSRWAATPIRIDGADQDWQGVPLLVDKGSKAEYALMNDGEHLYILFVFRSIPALSTYEVSGMKIFCSLDGKKNKGDGFHFVRKEIAADRLIASLEKNGEVLTEEKKAEIRKQKSYSLFEAEPVGPAKADAPAAADPSDPPTFRHQLKRSLSVVEFRIPLNRIFQSGAAAPGSTLKLGFEWGGMTPQMRSAYMARMAESGTRASERGAGDLGDTLRGDVEGGGGLGGLGGRPDPNTKKRSFWISVKLAVHGS